ncbi:HEAT repeat-containing protein 1 homolog [Culicoides brevitarsis]|uniref:HEAT repeat-containing protein 1 homolog n=1 Tax=Culicoides brevitarsis TaxID=469753 RepID=UPI00307B265F
MSTSLAEQLRRLQTPQTAALHDRKRFPSLLFDPKEAAEKDRETIYEIGVSGLEELIQIDPRFLIFRESLFDKGSLHLQRAVEDKEVNKQLDATIKSFMFSVSPYFMLQPAHKCLEWLIRRFRIQDYNKDEFMSLILPYHETRVAVRCIQTMSLKNPNDKWHWLLNVKKSGEPLSKQTIINHAISSPAFLEFIGNYTYEATKELTTKAHNLQVMFNFYCTTVIATIDTSVKIKEAHVHAVMRPITRGFESAILDFAASSFMIFSHMLTKMSLAKTMTERFAIMGLAAADKHNLSEEALAMIIISFQRQSRFTEVTDDMLDKFLNCKWLCAVLDQIYQKNLDILALIVPLLAACFKQIQDQSKLAPRCKSLCEMLLERIHYSPKDAETLIKSVLESYVMKNKKPQDMDGMTIELDSDEEMEDTTEKSVTEWYSGYLKRFETGYPESFDKIVNEIVSSKKSKKKQHALKNILDFFFKVYCSQDDGNMFEYLYDYNSERRAQSVKYVVANFEKLNSTSGGANLLKTALSERFVDDEPSVLFELFKMPAENLLKLFSVTELLSFCGKVLSKCIEMPLMWKQVAPHALSLIIQKEIFLGNEYLVMLLIFPFMTPTIDETKFKIEARKYSVDLGEKGGNVSKKLTKVVQAIIDNGEHFPGDLEQTLPIFEEFDVKSEVYALHKAVYLLNGLESNTEPEQGMKLLENCKKCAALIDTKDKRQSLLLTAVDLISKNVHFDKEDDDLSAPGTSLTLKLSLFNLLIGKFVVAEKEKEKEALNSALKRFVGVFCKTIEEKLEFFSLYFTADCVLHEAKDGEKRLINPQYQFYVMKMTSSALKSQVKVTDKTFIRYLMALASSVAQLRQAAFDVLLNLVNSETRWNILIEKLLERKEELVIDSEQLPLILYSIFGSGSNVKKASDKKALNSCFEVILDFIANQNVSNYEKARILAILKHIPDSVIFEKSSVVGNDILASSQQLIGKYESLILKEIVFRVDKDTVKAASKHPHVWNFILSALKSDALLQLFDHRSVSVAQKTLEAFNSDIYKAMGEKYRQEWFQTVVETSTFANNLQVHSAAGKMLKEITVEFALAQNLLEKMKTACQNEASGSEKERRQSFNKNFVQSETLQKPHWKQGITLLEFMQTKLQVDKPFELVGTLFDLLKRCFEFEEQSLVEYEKQLILTAILNSCKGPIPANQKKNIDKLIKIDLIIECVRGTQNPQTHHDALILLSHVASMIPEQVLQNIVSLFTFIGATTARHDDTYSFQIMSKVLENVIPIVVKQQRGDDKVISVLKIFSDIILDVAMHRRLIVYTKLLQTLGPETYLWQFLAVLFESHVVHYEKDPKSSKKSTHRHTNDDSEELQERLEIGLTIAKQFPCEIIVHTCTQLIKFLSQLPITEEQMKMKLPKDVTLIFDTKNHSFKHVRFYKYVTLQFLVAVLTSAEVTKEAEHISDPITLKNNCAELISETLKYFPAITKASAGQLHQKTWKVALSFCFDILESAILLLTPDLFIETVRDLIANHELITVRMKISDILITKLHNQRDYFNECNEENLLLLVQPLTEIIKNIGNDADLPKNATISEHWALQQLALNAIKLLARVLADTYPNDFKEVLKICTEKLCKHDSVCDKVLGSLVLCVSDLSATLKAHAIAQLPKIVPTTLKILENQNASKPDTVLLSIVIAISKIIEALYQFLSPYLTQLIIQLSRVYTEALSSTHPDAKTTNLIGKIKHIWQNLATFVPSRVIIPAINNSYKDIIKQQTFRAIGPIMDLTSSCFDNIPQQEFTTLQNELTSFFVKALQFRCDRRVTSEGVTEKDIEIVEKHVIQAFTGLILKLSESSFRPLFFKIHNWALVEAAASRERAITFFKLSHAISEALKGLFILFSSDLIEPMSKLLKATNASKCVDLYFESPEKNSVLVEYVLRTLKSICTHDSQKFMNPHRFGVIMEPLVDTVENSLIAESEDLKLLLQETIGALTVAVADDTLWKQLNLYLLEKMRCDEPEQKIFTLQICIEVARRLGEDFLQLLPETIPFFAELMESDVHEVERAVQRGLQELEKIVGEDLQKYF